MLQNLAYQSIASKLGLELKKEKSRYPAYFLSKQLPAKGGAGVQQVSVFFLINIGCERNRLLRKWGSRRFGMEFLSSASRRYGTEEGEGSISASTEG
ncbi:hypothetical protein CEXT_601651 [Caerostris extrusa]|uniref:Uncharacterized protein n=1 Tax=Caerostris extrusa TaxID=172846 RepID=A0AAV4PG00_CAEEX|nr:hypothetical protein CEXT_601651 [Caerostris extrusa]